MNKRASLLTYVCLFMSALTALANIGGGGDTSAQAETASSGITPMALTGIVIGGLILVGLLVVGLLVKLFRR